MMAVGKSINGSGGFMWYLKGAVSFFGADRVVEDLDLHISTYVGVNNWGQWQLDDIARFKAEALAFLKGDL